MGGSRQTRTPDRFSFVSCDGMLMDMIKRADALSPRVSTGKRHHGPRITPVAALDDERRAGNRWVHMGVGPANGTDAIAKRPGPTMGINVLDHGWRRRRVDDRRDATTCDDDGHGEDQQQALHQGMGSVTIP
jgi:hypothetical protein